MAKEITSYTFRIHKGSTSGVASNGWQKSPGLDTNAISSIEDSLDKLPSSGKVGTSIPTPLARVYLFKTAFELVASKADRKPGVYDELVADCLDILQLLFEKGGDASKFDFIPWNASDEIKNLRSANDEIVSRGNSNYHALRLLADSFELALNSAKEFQDTITLIKYDGILLGGTSPYTLVFTSANLRYELDKRRASDSGYDFSSNKKQEYCGEKRLPLSARPKEFQMFLKTFVNNASNLELFAHGGPLKPFADYVNAQTASVPEFTDDFDVSFPEIRGRNGSLNVLGIPLRYNDLATIPNESDFMMRPSVNYFRQYMAYEPLMIPSEFSSSGWIYVDDTWDPRTHIPNRVVKKLRADSSYASRCLPKNGSSLGEPTTQKYPWVSDEDFLTDHIIDLSYDLNTKYFFNNAKYPRFLLPIKKDYFMFFTLDDLKRNLKMDVDAKEIKNSDGHIIDVKINKILVELEIPLKSRKRSLKITREYLAEQTADYPIKKAKPGFGLGIFPFYKINEEELDLKNQYSVYLYNSGQSDSVKLYFFNIKKSLATPITSEDVLRTKLDSGTSKIYNLRSLSASNSFDLIEVDIRRGSEPGGINASFNDDYDSGLIIPEWGNGRVIGAESLGSDQKRTIFSIDFGTSNTHVAYWDPNENLVKPLEISHEDIQMVLLNKPYEKDNRIDYRERSSFGNSNPRFTEYLREFMPSIIGPQEKVSYPIKTATLEGHGFVNGKNLFGNINIGYDIENEQVDLSKASSFTYTTNLKWALQEDRTDGRKKNRVEAFCEQTLWILKNLLILKGFSPKDISIIYFYPESMMEDDKEMFKNSWNSAADIIFKQCGFSIKDNQCLSELESVAPYYSLLKRDESIYAYNSVNIDIGGGTTDFLIFDRMFVDSTSGKRSAAYESSILFAGNDIWGKTFPSGTKNGFVEFMRSKISSSVISEESMKALEFFNKKDDPAEMTTFFFKYKDFDYGGKIASNPKLRYVLFLHYAAIIFYLCDMIKQVRKKQNPDFKLPRSLTFTGKGSEYIKIITPDPEMISKITFALFVAYGFKPEEFEKGFHITYPTNPKGLTAEGGVYKLISDPAIKVNFVKKEDAAFSFMNGDDYISGRDTTEYENLGEYLIGFERIDGEDYVVDGVKDYKVRVMDHFNEMVKSIFNSDKVAQVLKSLEMNLEADDRKMTLELAEDSYDLQSEKFIREHTVGTAPIEGTIFFLAMKNLLINLSLKYFEKTNSIRN